MRMNARWKLTQRLARWRGCSRGVIQDDVPMERAEFLSFLQREWHLDS
jgi:hypothetical protein